MVALCNRADHYIFILWFLSSFFPRLISAVGDWMSTILWHMVWSTPSVNLECRSETCCARLAGNTGRKKVAKNRHLGIIAQLCRAISLQLKHVSTIGKKLFANEAIRHFCMKLQMQNTTQELRFHRQIRSAYTRSVFMANDATGVFQCLVIHAPLDCSRKMPYCTGWNLVTELNYQTLLYEENQS